MSTSHVDSDVADTVDRYWREHFRSPSLRELMEECDISSTSVAQYILERVADSEGYHVRDDGRHGPVPQWVVSAIQRAAP